jgi:hypothetical protein
LLSDAGVASHLSAVDYDIAILDNAATGCHSALVHQKNIPFILYGVLYWELLFRNAMLPSFVPSMFSSFSDQMSFLDRLQNTCIYLLDHVFLVSVYDVVVPHTAPPVSVVEIVESSLFYFVLDDISVAYPRPLMPNMIYVGDIVPQPVTPLSRDIARFVDGAEHGVVLASFGSFFDFLPPDIAAKFCSVFHSIPQKVIWKLKRSHLCKADPEKVMLLDWLPQNDLLGHADVKLFVSHCGMNSVLESIYHGKPIIGFPLGLDQPYIAARLHYRGLGYHMHVSDFTEQQLVEKISDIVRNDTIQENVARASRILRNKPYNPEKRVSYWIQHLVDNGTGHLKTNALKLSLFQFYCLDVMLVILAVIVVMTIVMCLCIRCTYRSIRYRCCSRKTKRD